MYNMDISIFGYKISLEILILIAVLYLITVGHTFCSCCNFYSLIEGNTTMIQDPSAVIQQVQAKVQAKVQQAQANQQLATQTTSGSPTTTSTTTSTTTPSTTSTTTPSTTATTTPSTTTGSFSNFGGKKEGFTGANINYGESSLYSLGNDNPVDTSSWSAQDMTDKSGQQLSAGVKAFMARPQQPVPLPEGEMLLFANTKFAPEFCPNTYSNSSGCAAMTGAQYNYLVTRGGNNGPYSEY